MASVKNWFNSLMGKPLERSNSVPGGSQNEDSVKAPKPTLNSFVKELKNKGNAEEDSVLQDLSALKRFLSGKMGKASAKMGSKSRQLTDQVKASNKAMKFIKFTVFIFVVLAIAYLSFLFIKKAGIGINKVDDNTVETEKPTPTPLNYQPEKPSIYANDDEVLRIEEAIDALEKEISRASLRESGLIPPVLDYNINFKSQ